MKVGVTSSSESPNESAGNWTCVHWRNNFHFSALSHLSIHNYFCILTIRKKEIRCGIKEMPLGKSLELNDKEKLDLYSQGSITEDVLFDCFLFREGQITRSKGDTLQFLVPCSHSTQVYFQKVKGQIIINLWAFQFGKAIPRNYATPF